MTRKNRTFKLDDRVLDALERLAQKNNTSANRYLENLLFSHGKAEGELPAEISPLGDARGGKRDNSGRPRKEAEETEDIESEDEARATMGSDRQQAGDITQTNKALTPGQQELKEILLEYAAHKRARAALAQQTVESSMSEGDTPQTFEVESEDQ